MENNLIVKSNDLVQAHYDLDLLEQKIILYAVSKIDTSKDKFNIIQIEIKEFTRLIESTVKRYTEFREIANKLMDRKVRLADRPNLDVRWLASSEYIGNGTIELEFSEKLVPYLLQLKKRFTRYQLKNILYLKNKYSIRIYELMKQYQNIGKRDFKIDELKNILMIENDQYTRIYDFERFIIKSSMEEINANTDININYIKNRKGRKIESISFNIQAKDQVDKEYETYLKTNYNISELKEKMGISEEKFNSKQVIELYTIAIEKADGEGIDIFEYVKLNYLDMKSRNTARNNFSYLKNSLENDYAFAIGRLKLNYVI